MTAVTQQDHNDEVGLAACTSFSVLVIMHLTAAAMLAALAATSAAVAPPACSLLFVAEPGNDVLAAARKGALTTKCFATVAEAVAAAAPNDGLLVMAEAMLPSNPGVPQVAAPPFE